MIVHLLCPVWWPKKIQKKFILNFLFWQFFFELKGRDLQKKINFRVTGIFLMWELCHMCSKIHQFFFIWLINIRVECGIFLIKQNRSSNPRSGMILEVQIRSFGASVRQCMWVKVFIFKKIPGGLNINIFGENWYMASFYNKKQRQKYKF